MMIFMFVFMALALTALIAGVVWLVRTASDSRRPDTPSPLEALELRYARGEIDRDEYHQRRDDLERRG